MNAPSFKDGDWPALKSYLAQLAQTLTPIEGGQGKTADFKGATILGQRPVADLRSTSGEVRALWVRLGFLAAASEVGEKAIVADEIGEYTYIGKAASGTLPTVSLWTVYRFKFNQNPVNGLDEFAVEASTANPTAVWADRLSLPF